MLSAQLYHGKEIETISNHFPPGPRVYCVHFKTLCAKQHVKNGPMLWMSRIRKVKHTPPGPQDDTVQWFLFAEIFLVLLYSAYMNGVIFC